MRLGLPGEHHGGVGGEVTVGGVARRLDGEPRQVEVDRQRAAVHSALQHGCDAIAEIGENVHGACFAAWWRDVEGCPAAVQSVRGRGRRPLAETRRDVKEPLVLADGVTVGHARHVIRHHPRRVRAAGRAPAPAAPPRVRVGAG